MAQQTEAPQPNGDAAPEGDALDELEAALGDEEGAGGEPQEWTPPTREQHEAQQAAHQAELEKERAKLKRAREQAKRLREGRGALAQGEPADGGEQPTGPDPQVVVWQQRAVRGAAKAELQERGANPGMVDLLLGQLRTEQIEFDDDDNPDLDEWLDRMQEKYPDVFVKAAPAEQQGTRRPMGAVDQGRAKGTPVGRQMSYGERVLANSRAAMQGGRRGAV